MTRHLNRRNKCIKNILSYKFNDQELYNLSLIPIHKPIEIEEDNSIKDETLCIKCNKRFSTKGNLMKHLKKKCINIDEHPYYNIKKDSKDLDKDLDKDEDLNTNIVNDMKKIGDNYHERSFLYDDILESGDKKERIIPTNNIVYNQHINNYNFYNIKYPIGFDKEWDLSKISNEKKLFLICCSNTKYSELLKYILQNDDNLNVIIEDDTNSGIVYKNDTEKFINMDKSDIIDQSLSKLNKQLNELCEEVIKKNELLSLNDKICDETIKINQKYNDYCKDDSIKLAVKDIMTNIYNEKKDKTIEIMNTLLQKYNDNLIQDGDENGF
jgi:hypothetical protein